MIYCVEDDENIRNLITYTLNASGFESTGFSCANEFWKAMEAEDKPQLILLDIMLPGEDGLSILRKLKNVDKTKGIPVIMTTAKGTEYDKVIGLDLGADDYLAKPFGMMEMVARCKAVLRRFSDDTKKEELTNGTIRVDEIRHVAYSNNRPLELTLKEYDLLSLFLNNLDKVFTRDQLLLKVWGLNFVGESRTVDVHVGTLRTKLGDNGTLIETVRGVGYKMVKGHEKEDI